MKLWNFVLSAGIFVFRKRNLNEHRKWKSTPEIDVDAGRYSDNIISNIPPVLKFPLNDKQFIEPPVSVIDLNDTTIERIIDIYNIEKEIDGWKRCIQQEWKENAQEPKNIFEGGLLLDWMIII